MSRSLVLTAVLALALGVSVVGVSAADYTCTGSLGAVTVDDVVVPTNATCTLNGTTVTGNITIEQGATLNATAVKVDGNIQTVAPAAAVNVYAGSRVDGSIQVKQSGSSTVQGVHIIGDLYFDANTSALKAEGNTVGGNLQAFQNTGGVFITANTIDGNLQCRANVPAPVGMGNIVHGNAEDQCAALNAPAFSSIPGVFLKFIPR